MDSLKQTKKYIDEVVMPDIRAKAEELGLPDHRVRALKNSNPLMIGLAIAYDHPEWAKAFSDYITVENAKADAENGIKRAEKIAKEKAAFAYMRERDKYHDLLDKEIAMAEESREALIQLKDVLNNCETPEAADKVRMMYLYRSMVDVMTCYDNTAYIKGLAQIIANGPPVPVDEVPKLNLDEKPGRWSR